MSRRVVSEPATVARPLELCDPLQVWSRLATQGRHRPDADIAPARATWLANPKGDQRSIGREPRGSNGGICEFLNTSVGQIVERPRTGLGKPDVRLPVPVRQKRYQMAVA